MKTLGIVIVLGSLASTARADQCAMVDAAVAARAQQLLAAHPTFLQFCEPCGDVAPGVPGEARTITVVDREVAIDGQRIDLAYTYVRTSPMQLSNLAVLAGCPATGVSPTLLVRDETAYGIMIEPLAAPTLARVPPTVVAYQTIESVPWYVVALAAGGGCGLGVAIASWRRRRPMRPRATEL